MIHEIGVLAMSSAFSQQLMLDRHDREEAAWKPSIWLRLGTWPSFVVAAVSVLAAHPDSFGFMHVGAAIALGCVVPFASSEIRQLEPFLSRLTFVAPALAAATATAALFRIVPRLLQ